MLFHHRPSFAEESSICSLLAGPDFLAAGTRVGDMAIPRGMGSQQMLVRCWLC